MAAGRARALRSADPRKRRVRILGSNGQPRGIHPLWIGNKDIALPCETGEFQTLVDGPNARPYIESKTKEQWTWKPYRPNPALIVFSDAEITFAEKFSPQVILEPNCKAIDGRSNKNWGWERWEEFSRLACSAGYSISQIGLPGTRVLSCSTLIPTNDFRIGCAVLARACAYVGHEGGLHHAAAALGIPAVVVFGAFISPECTGYAQHVNLFTGHGLGCGMRVPCPCCIKAMASITPEQALEGLERICDNRKDGSRRETLLGGVAT